MKHTSQFIQAIPSKKPHIIADGYDFMAVTADTTTLNLKKLTMWLKAMPDMIITNESAMPDKNMIKAYESYIRAADALSAEIVANAEAMQKVFDTIQAVRKNGSTSKTISRQ